MKIETLNIFQCAGNDKTDIASDPTDGDKLLPLSIMPQCALADAKLAPRLRINPVDICIEIISHYQIPLKQPNRK